MRRFLLVSLSSLLVAWLLSCSGKSSPLSANSGGGTGMGTLALSIDLGSVGLAKKTETAAINLDSLTLDFSATGETPIHRVYPLSGNGQQIVSNSFSFDPRLWSLTVKTYCTQMAKSFTCPMCQPFAQTRIVHQGSTSFNVVAGDTATVNMAVSAQYSMLLLRVNSIPDSVNDAALYSGDSLNMANSMNELADTSFPVGSMGLNDTAKLHYDWLNVMSVRQSVQVVLHGSWSGSEIPLYWGALDIPQVIAGQDTTYNFNINWIGPGGVPQVKTITVTAGKIGLITAVGTPIPKPN
jgi:hypothetical protein